MVACTEGPPAVHDPAKSENPEEIHLESSSRHPTVGGSDPTMVQEPIDQSRPSSGHVPLWSTFHGDMDMRPIVEMFLAEIPARVQTIQSAVQGGDLPRLRRIVHQIKGAGGGYGFPQISEAAQKLENCLDASGEAWRSQILVPMETFLNILARAHAGRKG